MKILSVLLILCRCEDFLTGCFTNMNESSCCGNYFDPKPKFSSQGACFSTHINKRYMGPMDKIVIVLNLSKAYSIGLDDKKYGPAFSRNAASIAFHSQDHGLAAINTNNQAINRGTVNEIKLQKILVFNY